ncbi:MAG TPA: SpoIIE family protein phosphatase [Bacteroidia bacterium]|nr:SpoIIE family protein phosphatase [Bacteroidia bacterium]
MLKGENNIYKVGRCKSILIIGLLLFCFMYSFGQNSNELGLFDMRNYTNKEYSQAPQNFAIVQDLRGVLYIGNNNGILEYDGETWNMIKTPNESPVHSLTIDKRGTIYVGGTGEIGYLKPDSIGKMKYYSLIDTVIGKDFTTEIWSCFATKDGNVYFQSSSKLFIWNGKNMTILNSGGIKSDYHLMFYVKGELYVRQKETGLMHIVNGMNLVLIQGGELFAESKVYMMLPFGHDQILLNMRTKGLYLMKPGVSAYTPHVQSSEQLTKITPFHTQIDDFFANAPVYNGLNLDNNNISIGTLGSGIVVIDSSGNLLDAVNKKTGLQDASVNNQFLDAEHKLWLATNNGVTKVDINSPITKFNDQNGLEGTVESIIRHNGKLYAVTDLGIYYLQEQAPSAKSQDIEQSHFVKIPGESLESWDLLSFHSGKQSILLAACTTGIYQIDGDKVSSIVNCVASVMHRSIKDSNRVFIGLTDGFASIYWNNGKWIDEGKISASDITEDVRSIEEEKDGSVWLGNNGTGLTHVMLAYNGNKIQQAQVVKYGTKENVPDEPVYVKAMNGHIYFAANTSGLLKFEKGRFVKDSSLGKQFATGELGIVRLNMAPDSTIWMVCVHREGQIELGYLKPEKDNKYTWVKTPFMGLSKAITYAIYHDVTGVTWVGGPDGVARYDKKIQKNYTQEYHALIRKVVIGKDSTIFSGTFFTDSGRISLVQPDRLKPSIKYIYNTLDIYFSAPDFEDESATQYSYFLDGFDKGWSIWKHDVKAHYTNLPEGQYFFHVKAKNIFGYESQEAIYEFTVLSPWYRTVWAYIGYVLFFIAFVVGAITVSTRSLRNIISERTAEVVKQKEVIEMKNKDITDSINYAKRIQDAILPTTASFRRLFPDSFFLFKPKDIVSGDFYWLSEINDRVFIAAADCTGHGVPGAMVSVVCSNALNRAVKEFEITEPGKILDKVRELVLETFEKSEADVKDGMDISLACFDPHTKQVQWSGANNSFWYVRGDELMEIGADKQPIGKNDNPKPFKTHTITAQKGDSLYLYTDGYADQFGGPQGKKFMKKRFKELLVNLRNLTMKEQWRAIDKAIVEWQGPGEQIDDILVIGIKV